MIYLLFEVDCLFTPLSRSAEPKIDNGIQSQIDPSANASPPKIAGEARRGAHRCGGRRTTWTYQISYNGGIKSVDGTNDAIARNHLNIHRFRCYRTWSGMASRHTRDSQPRFTAPFPQRGDACRRHRMRPWTPHRAYRKRGRPNRRSRRDGCQSKGLAGGRRVRKCRRTKERPLRSGWSWGGETWPISIRPSGARCCVG